MPTTPGFIQPRSFILVEPELHNRIARFGGGPVPPRSSEAIGLLP